MHLSPLAARILLYIMSRLPFLLAEPHTSHGRYLCREGGTSPTTLECLFVCPATLRNTSSISLNVPVPTTAWTSTVTSSVETGTATVNEASSTSTPSEPSNDATVEARLDRAHFPSFDDWREAVLKQNMQQRTSYRTGASPDKAANEPDTDRDNRSDNADYDGYGEDSAYLFDADERLDKMAASRRNSGNYQARPMPPSSAPNTARNNMNGNMNKEGKDTPLLDKPSGGIPESSNDMTDALAIATPTTSTTATTVVIPTPPVDMKDMRDQSNYASFDCGATVLASNSEAKGATAILFDTKEQYMLNRCSAKKFVIIELCDEILVDTVMLANHEFFSSMFKDFRISVTDQYLRSGHTNWRTLGHYQARNARDLQAFHVQNPILWTRYLRIDFLSHYGNEYYCPVSVLRVYGPTMMEQYRREEQAAESTITDQLLNDAATLAQTTTQMETITDSPPNETTEHVDTNAKSIPNNESSTVDNGNNDNSDNSSNSSNDTRTTQEQPSDVPSIHDAESTIASTSMINDTGTVQNDTLQSSSDALPSVDVTDNVPISVDSTTTTQNVSISDIQDENDATDSTIATSTTSTTTIADATVADTTTTDTTIATIIPPHLADNVDNTENSDPISTGTIDISTSILSANPTATVNTQNPSVDAPVVTVHVASSSSSSSSFSVSSIPPVPPSPSPSPVMPIIPPAPAATTQESIFRTITKRLSALELNLTLSHRYLEEQSRELNRVFANVESQFEALKTRAELDLAKRLEKQQVQTEAILQELHQLNLKVHVLADEIMFEKRMGFIQLLLIFAVVVLVGIVYVPVSVWFPSASSNAIMSWTPISGQVSVSPFLRAQALSAPASPNSIGSGVIRGAQSYAY
ncbi:UNC-like C-terminal-domain-containing protein [Syncephalis plumigaleata]|nr:UNC-like C-terminal-domain-containing protein [Syncephalis plumigaleata]